MDCKTARQFLDFARPRRPELDATELEELEAHLAECPDCGPLAQVERQIDSRLAQAMQAMPVPQDLRGRVLDRLQSDRRVQVRKARRWIAVLAAAAALLLASWVGWKLLEKPLRVDVEELAYADYGKTINPRPDQVEDYFRSEGITTVAPADANYGFLRDYYVDTYRGKRVPKLHFTDGKSSTVVYIFSTKDFDVAAANPPPDGSGWTAGISFDPSQKYGYLVIYIGEPALKVIPLKGQKPPI